MGPDSRRYRVAALTLLLPALVPHATAAPAETTFGRAPHVGVGSTAATPPHWLFATVAAPAESAAAAADSGASARRTTPRPVRTGRTAGAVVGGLAGGLMGTAVAVYGQAACEYECPEPTFGYFLAWSGGGLLIGATIGYLVGSFLGSLVPSGEAGPPVDATKPDDPNPPGGPGGAAGTPPTGSLGLELIGGAFTSRPENDPGAGGRVSLLRHPSTGFSYGAEIQYLDADMGVWSYGLTARKSWPLGSVRPALSLGLAVNDFRQESTLIGGVIGAGLEYPSRAGADAWRVEARYHWNLQNSEYSTDGGSPRFRFVTVGIGYRVGW